jgi:hypothetical protein
MKVLKFIMGKTRKQTGKTNNRDSLNTTGYPEYQLLTLKTDNFKVRIKHLSFPCELS